MQEAGYEPLIIVIVCVAAAIAAYLLYRVYTRRRIARWLRILWGRKTDRAITADEMSGIREITLFLHPEERDSIDDITWNDLEMDRVYKQMCHCLTNAGDHMLYATLRNPNGNTLQENMQAIHWAEKAGEREAVRKQLYLAGRVGNIDIRMLLQDNPFNVWTRVLSILLCAGLITCIVLSILGFPPAIFGILAFLFINGYYSHRTHQDNAKYIDTIGYLVSVIRCARNISNAVPDIPVLDNGRLRRLLKATARIRRNATLELFYTTDSITMLFNSLFMLENISFSSLAKAMEQCKDEVLELYRMAGTLDAMVAAASWRASLPGYCEPELIEQEKPALHTEGLVHPLLENAVPNDFSTTHGVLITGSNATGKSTFIKSIAVNAILAQSIGTCTARRWRAGVFRILTSMALRDNITSGESYFVAEIKSLKRILDAVNGKDRPCLCIIDEVLRGTNTGERIAASGELLLRFARGNCICIVATHDIELSLILEEYFTNMHFAEQIGSEGMLFDFRIREGRSTGSNAIKLLGRMGYDSDIVENAQARLEVFNRTGTWPVDMV